MTVDGEIPVTVSVTLAPGASVRGTVGFDGARQPIPRFTYVHLVPADLDGPITEVDNGVSAPIGSDGAFVLAGEPPGRYLLRVAMQDWELESARVGDVDAADEPFEVKRDDIAGVAVTLTQSRTLLKGTVVSAAGTPVNAADIVLFPSDRRFWTRGTRRVAMARTNIDGQFEIAGLPAGETRSPCRTIRTARRCGSGRAGGAEARDRVTIRKGETLTHRIAPRR